MEAYGYFNPDQDSDEDDGNFDDNGADDDDGNNGDDDKGGVNDGDQGGSASAVTDVVPAVVPAGAPADAMPAVAPANVLPSVDVAREVLIHDARNRGDDVLLRRLLNQRSGCEKVAKDSATDVAKALQKRALEQQHATQQKRAAARQEETLARLDEELASQRKAKSLERQAELRLQVMQEMSRKNRDDHHKRLASLKFKAEHRWISLEYPRALAARLVRKAPHGVDKHNFEQKMLELAKKEWFRFWPKLPLLYDVDKTVLIRHGDCKPYDGSLPRVVKCSATFDAFLDEVACKTRGSERDGYTSLRSLVEMIAPGSARHLFGGEKGFLRMLHQNDYVLDKTFVCCVYSLSKWLGAEIFPNGIYAWPPVVPNDALPLLPPAQPLDDVEGAVQADIGLPAMGSDGRL